jgi:hypothetical protein
MSCRRHDWRFVYPAPPEGEIYRCARCGAIRSPESARRGRNNRQRGNSIEREVGKALGLTRVGQYGTPTDLGATAEPFAVQVKSGGAFSERQWSWLKAVPTTASQTPLLVIADAPGPGHRRRAVVVLDLADWIALHGPSGVREPPWRDNTDGDPY